MPRLACLLCAVGGVLLSSAGDPSRPHSHQGLLVAYNRGGYTKAGILMDSSVEERLRLGPVVTVSNLPDGVIRSTSIQDVEAPPDIVWGLLTDFNNYPNFIDGIKSCTVYKKQWNLSGAQVVCADYKLRVGTFTLQYFLEHVHEPLKNSMTWTLDYSRYSDVHDSVGYWQVLPHNGGSRVFYATDSVLPTWIPGPIRAAFASIAMKKATAKLPSACKDALTAKEQERGIRFVSFRKPQVRVPAPMQRFLSRAKAPLTQDVVEVSRTKRAAK
uniref:Coenzyme Q-binding protein COQ10 START domain-containing protein n=1 Tax=Prymnesium polylepis TaxID=72548 RepID=A0A7S4JU22_9EUKA